MSKKELVLLQDSEVMPSKFQILWKLEQQLIALKTRLLEDSKTRFTHLPIELFLSSWKISRGENYRQNPYRVLDYPSAFSKENIFTFRTLILWGYPIGFHLILKGIHKELFRAAILSNYTQLPSDYYISQQNNPWIWEADDSDLISLSQLHKSLCRKIIDERNFIRLSYFLPLKNYDQIPQVGAETWVNLYQVLTMQ